MARFERPTAAEVRFRNLGDGQRRLVTAFTYVSLFVLGGLTFTGIWQFFGHTSDPGWYGYTPENQFRPLPPDSVGMAAAHARFADLAAVLTLIGLAWFATRILFDVPKLGVVAFVLVAFGHISGPTIRFNTVKIVGETYETAGRGYAQIFLRDLDFVVTDRLDFGPWGIRIWTLLHIITFPIFVFTAYKVLTKAHVAPKPRKNIHVPTPEETTGRV